jgi:hypothetical protein
MASVLSTQCPPIEASSIYRTQQSRFRLMTREELSLETLWEKKIRIVDKVQITDRSNGNIMFHFEIILKQVMILLQIKLLNK